MDTQLQVLAKRLVKLGKVVLVLCDLANEIHALLDNVLSDDLENLVLLERFTRDVQREILRVDDTLDKVEVFGDEVLAVVHDKNAANIELDVVALLLGLEEVEWRADVHISEMHKTSGKTGAHRLGMKRIALNSS
jgi:hypothetical protein